MVAPEASFKHRLWQLGKEQRKQCQISHSQSDCSVVLVPPSYWISYSLRKNWHHPVSRFSSLLFALQEWTAEEVRCSRSWQTSKRGLKCRKAIISHKTPAEVQIQTRHVHPCAFPPANVVSKHAFFRVITSHWFISASVITKDKNEKNNSPPFFVAVRYRREKIVLISIGEHPRSLQFQFSFHSINETGCGKSQIFPINLKPFSRLASNYNNIHI